MQSTYNIALELFRNSHKPEHIQDPMVYEVWEDGEITLTKGGDLYGQRNLHCVLPGGKKSLYLSDIPSSMYRYTGHARCIVADHETAQKISNAIHSMEI